MIFKNGDTVSLVNNVYKTESIGVLHLPDLEMFMPSNGRTFLEPQSTGGSYGVYTIVIDGKKFRNEGELKKVS